jgi:4-diphosphocytidyl-2-C-methyl-D-erythritol kinase
MNVRSPAKLNLFLHVYGREQGFHMLNSALAFLDLHDEIEFQKSEEFIITISGKYANSIDLKDNIFTTINDYFRQKFNITANLNIKLVKNIPVGAGLGGGSSNGAKLIEFFNKQYNLQLNPAQLQEISFNFGSDIAFFLQNKASFIKKRGEVAQEVKKFNPIDIILILPDFELYTAKVFGNFDEKFNNKEVNINLDLEQLMRSCGNDLLGAAFKTNNKLKEIYDIANNIDGIELVRMSGSGSTIFAVAKDGKIDLAIKYLTEKLPECAILKNSIKWSDE